MMTMLDMPLNQQLYRRLVTVQHLLPDCFLSLAYSAPNNSTHSFTQKTGKTVACTMKN